jgi:hypothetical protein
MLGNRDDPVTPRRLQIHPLRMVSVPTEDDDGEKPFHLVAVGLWSIVGVTLTALLIWLALGID